MRILSLEEQQARLPAALSRIYPPDKVHDLGEEHVFDMPSLIRLVISREQLMGEVILHISVSGLDCQKFDGMPVTRVEGIIQELFGPYVLLIDVALVTSVLDGEVVLQWFYRDVT